MEAAPLPALEPVDDDELAIPVNETDLPEARTYQDGLVRFRLKDYAAAAQRWTESLRFDPEAVMAYYNRGIARRRMGQLELALDDFTQALQRDETLADAYFHRGNVLVGLREFNGAKADFQRAAELYLAMGQLEDHRDAVAHLRDLV